MLSTCNFHIATIKKKHMAPCFFIKIACKILRATLTANRNTTEYGIDFNVHHPKYYVTN